MPGAKQTFAEDIDKQGDIIGVYYDNDGTHGFIRRADGVFQFFSGPDNALPGGMSANGLITGGIPQDRAFIGTLEGAVMPFYVREIHSPSGLDINSTGEVAGFGTGLTQADRAFFRNANGRVRKFDAPGAGTASGLGTRALAIAEDGTICGTVTTRRGRIHGFLRDKHGNVTVFDPPRAKATVAIAIARDGTVMGSYLDSGVVWHAYMRAPDGSFASFDAPGAGTEYEQGTMLKGVNRKGFITGSVIDSSYVSHGYVRNPNAEFELFDAPGAGQGSSEGTVPWRVNDHNEVVGVYYDEHLQAHSFIRLP